MSTGELSDTEFLAAVEATTYPGPQFGHRGHLRLGWLCLREHGFEKTQQESHNTSIIPGWSEESLDTTIDGQARKPDSLYMEGSRPA